MKHWSKCRTVKEISKLIKQYELTSLLDCRSLKQVHLLVFEENWDGPNIRVVGERDLLDMAEWIRREFGRRQKRVVEVLVLGITAIVAVGCWTPMCDEQEDSNPHI